MKQLVICRHGESQWNFENKFTGWVDVPLTQKGIKEAKECGKILKKNEFFFDIAYTSLLERANSTLEYCLKEIGLNNIITKKDWRLNERHYGSLQGMDKIKTVKKYGKKQVMVWRRSFKSPPPPISKNDQSHPINNNKYSHVKKSLLPSSESLKDVIKRFLPLWNETILKDIKDNKKVLIVAHGNSLRALIKVIKNLSDEEITNFNIPTGIPMVIELDSNIKFHKNYYLGDQKKIAKKINSVLNQLIAK